MSSLAHHISAQAAATKSQQLELLQQWQEQQQASQVYLEVLQQVLDSLMELVQDHLLGKQQVSHYSDVAEVTCNWCLHIAAVPPVLWPMMELVAVRT